MSEQVPFNLQRETLGSEGEAEPILVQRACRVRWRAGASGAVLAFVPDAEGRRDGEDSGEDDCECEEDGEDDECGAWALPIRRTVRANAAVLSGDMFVATFGHRAPCAAGERRVHVRRHPAPQEHAGLRLEPRPAHAVERRVVGNPWRPALPCAARLRQGGHA